MIEIGGKRLVERRPDPGPPSKRPNGRARHTRGRPDPPHAHTHQLNSQRPCYARLAKCIVGLLAHPAQENLDSQVRISDLSRDVSREQRARHQASLGVESVGAEYPSPASASR